MSETDLNREPIELVEIVLPRCANTYGVAPCTASGAVGSECFNCRATCQDPENYRDRPDGGLTPDNQYGVLQSITTGSLDETSSLFWALDVQLPNSVTTSIGGLFYYGQNTPGAIAFGTGLSPNSGKLVYGAKQGANEALIVVDADALGYSGKRLIFFGELDFVASGTSTIRLWVFDPVELKTDFLGSDTYSTGATWAAANATGGFSTSASGSFANVATIVRLSAAVAYSLNTYTQAAPANMTGDFGQRLWLGRGVQGEPTDEQYILPCLDSLGTIGTKINLAGSDDDYRPLGRRATLDFTASDFAHSDVTQDPYLATRLYDPMERSTFWRKWLQRQKFGKVGARVRVYEGYAGQPLSAYLKRGYVLEEAKWTENGVAFYCRDELSRTEFLKSQVPAPSPGVLSLDITDTDTSLTMAGIFTSAEYPGTPTGNGGTIRINDEIIEYDTKTIDIPLNTTTLGGLTRGAQGTTAAEHSQNDRVQLCKVYTDETIQDVILDLLLSAAEIPGQFVDQTLLASEQAAYLGAYSLTALLSEPTAVDTVLGWICQEANVYIWWDERAQKIRIKAIRAVSATDIVETLTHESNIIADSMRLTEKPRQRLNIITVYYNPRNKAGDLDDVTNYANALRLVNGTTSAPEQYGNVIQTRTIFSRFLTTEAVVNQTAARLSERYADIPVFAEFLVDAKDRSLWTGDIIRISHPAIVDTDGLRDVRRWLIVEAEEIDPGHIVRYVCADITLDGLIYLITEDGIGTYTPELFDEGNAFITSDAGLNPDGSNGARIS